MRRVAPLNPGQQSNLILFGRFVLKAINKLHPQKAALSANLDSLEVQPFLSGLVSPRLDGWVFGRKLLAVRKSRF
jgi:hypothetical protein